MVTVEQIEELLAHDQTALEKCLYQKKKVMPPTPMRVFKNGVAAHIQTYPVKIYNHTPEPNKLNDEISFLKTRIRTLKLFIKKLKGKEKRDKYFFEKIEKICRDHTPEEAVAPLAKLMLHYHNNLLNRTTKKIEKKYQSVIKANQKKNMHIDNLENRITELEYYLKEEKAFTVKQQEIIRGLNERVRE